MFFNPSFRGRDITVVSDSNVAISWVNQGDFGNVALVQTIYEIRKMLKSVGCIKVAFDSRIFNSFTDSLAKIGANRSGDFVERGDI